LGEIEGWFITHGAFGAVVKVYRPPRVWMVFLVTALVKMRTGLQGVFTEGYVEGTPRTIHGWILH
jgi:hypothetical protein